MDFRAKGADAVEDDSCEEGGATVFGAERELGHVACLDNDVILVRMRDEWFYTLARISEACEDCPSGQKDIGCQVSEGTSVDLCNAWVDAIEGITRTRSRSVVGLAVKKMVIEERMNIEGGYREGQAALLRSFFDDFDRLVGTSEGGLGIARWTKPPAEVCESR
jgi:hypothetical protein